MKNKLKKNGKNKHFRELSPYIFPRIYRFPKSNYFMIELEKIIYQSFYQSKAHLLSDS